MCISIYHYLYIYIYLYIYLYIYISNLIYVQYFHISIDYRHKYEFTSHCQGSPHRQGRKGLLQNLAKPGHLGQWYTSGELTQI